MTCKAVFSALNGNSINQPKQTEAKLSFNILYFENNKLNIEHHTQRFDVNNSVIQTERNKKFKQNNAQNITSECLAIVLLMVIIQNKLLIKHSNVN